MSKSFGASSVIAAVPFSPVADIVALHHSLCMRRNRDRIIREMAGFGNKRGETLAEDLQLFLCGCCRSWGFCNSLADDILDGGGLLTPDAFATAVLAAEGWPEPELEREAHARLERAFIARYGGPLSTDDYERG